MARCCCQQICHPDEINLQEAGGKPLSIVEKSRADLRKPLNGVAEEEDTDGMWTQSISVRQSEAADFEKPAVADMTTVEPLPTSDVVAGSPFSPAREEAQESNSATLGAEKGAAVPSNEVDDSKTRRSYAGDDSASEDGDGEPSEELSEFGRQLKARQTLDAAMGSPEKLGALRKALKNAEKAGLSASETSFAEAHLESKKAMARKSLAAAACGADLRAALRDAKDVGLDDEELQGARADLEAKQAQTRKSLSAAMASPNTGTLKDALRDAEVLGLNGADVATARSELATRTGRSSEKGGADGETAYCAAVTKIRSGTFHKDKP